LAYFLTLPIYREETLRILYREHGGVSLPHGVVHWLVQALISGTQPLGYLVIARLMLDSPPHPEDLTALVWKLSGRPEPAMVRALLLAICCCLSHDGALERSLGECCLKFAEVGAPYSAVLFGQLRSKGVTFSNIDAYRQEFEKMAEHANQDFRAAAVFALGHTWDIRAIPTIAARLMDSSDIVAEQAVLALTVALRFDPTRFRLDDAVVNGIRQGIAEAQGREGVRDVYTSVKGALDEFFARLEGRAPQNAQGRGPELEMRLVSRITTFVRGDGLAEQYERSPFSASLSEK
jgi:hypothetical protein